jgi:hypothetical protein
MTFSSGELVCNAEAGSVPTTMEAHMQNAVKPDINFFIARISFLRIQFSSLQNCVQPEPRLNTA